MVNWKRITSEAGVILAFATFMGAGANFSGPKASRVPWILRTEGTPGGPEPFESGDHR
jgi:hypothetical protein